MDNEKKFLALKASKLGTGLADEVLMAIAGVSEKKHFSEGQPIVETGDPCDGLYVLVEGTAHVENTFAGTKKIVGKLADGDFFGEVALLGAEKRSSSVVADSELDCLLLPVQPMHRLFEEFPGIKGHLEGVGHSRTTTNLEVHLGELPELEE